jgi:gliding motility-associated lipoprotein GldD
MKPFKTILIILISVVYFSSCSENYTPKPRGYFRIDLPKKSYVKLDSVFPYTFDYPVYANITGDPYAPNEKNWINVNFPDFKAVLHISYEKVDNNLAQYLNDAHTLVSKHIPKAEAIYDSLIYHPDKQVYGLAFKIEGIGTASPFQFYVTDSVQHYLRGALYFNLHPNNDSLAPVIDFLEKDINHMISTLEWKNDKH